MNVPLDHHLKWVRMAAALAGALKVVLSTNDFNRDGLSVLIEEYEKLGTFGQGENLIPEIERLRGEVVQLQTELSNTKAELEEQCRLHGKGAEREKELLAEVERLKPLVKANALTFPQVSHVFEEMLSEEKSKRDKLEADKERLLEALEKIRTEHCQYEHGDGSYGIGVTDGHRCAANIAKEALAAHKKETSTNSISD